jgi:hypothetical protein
MRLRGKSMYAPAGQVNVCACGASGAMAKSHFLLRREMAEIVKLPIFSQ